MEAKPAGGSYGFDLDTSRACEAMLFIRMHIDREQNCCVVTGCCTETTDTAATDAGPALTGFEWLTSVRARKSGP